MRIVSLTSVPPRFGGLGPVLESLLAQRPAPDRVVLALPRAYRRFPGQVDPPALPAGVTLLRTGTDHGPATKLLAPLDAWPDASRVVYCDDDCLYGDGWLSELEGAAARLTRPAIVAASGFDIARLKRRPVRPDPSAKDGWTDVAQGFGGVLVPVAALGARLVPPPQAAFAADDLWLSAQFAARGVPIALAPAARAAVTPLDRPEGLQDARFDGRGRAALYRETVMLAAERFDVWPPI